MGFKHTSLNSFAIHLDTMEQKRKNNTTRAKSIKTLFVSLKKNFYLKIFLAKSTYFPVFSFNPGNTLENIFRNLARRENH